MTALHEIIGVQLIHKDKLNTSSVVASPSMILKSQPSTIIIPPSIEKQKEVYQQPVELFITNSLLFTHEGSIKKRFKHFLRFKAILRRIVLHPVFDYFILACITISAILLAIENPTLSTSSILYKVLQVCNIIITTIFAIEMILKIVALGIIATKLTYFRSGWNCLDAFIVITSIISIFITSSVRSIRILRLVRVLRPLRFISKSSGMR